MRLPRRFAPRNDGAGIKLNPPHPLFEREKLISEQHFHPQLMQLCGLRFNPENIFKLFSSPLVSFLPCSYQGKNRN